MTKFDYSLNGQPLESVDQVKYLGFLYVPSLDFCPHIDFRVSKALRVLGFVRKHSIHFNNPKCLFLLHNALIRSTLEYGAVVWSPYNISITKKLNRIQNHLLSFASYRLNIASSASRLYRSMIDLFKLKSLSERQKISSCHFIWGLLEGQIDAPNL